MFDFGNVEFDAEFDTEVEGSWGGEGQADLNFRKVG